MNKKIIFLDVDGTLTEPGTNAAPESALAAIRTAQKNGHKVFLCTGRNLQMVSPLLVYSFDGVIASSGGYILCGDELIYDCPMTKEQQAAALDVLKRNGIYRTVECLNGSYTDEEFKEFLVSESQNGGNSELIRWRKQIETSLGIRPMAEYDGQPVYKIVIMYQRKSQIVEPKKKLEHEFAFCIQDKDAYGIINGEVVNRKFDKGQGVLRICRHLDADVSDCIGFGDSANDKEMLETCGTSVCMANGSESMKELADLVCPAVTEDGMLQAFRKLNLI